MAEPAGRPIVAAASDQGQAAPAQQRQQGFRQSVTGIIRMAVFWYFAMKFFGPKRAPADPSQLMSNLFQKGEPLDMWLYLSDKEKFNDFGNEDALIWHEANIPYAVWGPTSSRSLSLKYYPSEALKHNGSLYAHAFFARLGYPPDPNDPEYEPLSTFSRSHPVVVFLPKPKDDKKKSLLGDSKEAEEKQPVSEQKNDDQADKAPLEWISYWKPNITINLVDDFTRYPHNNIPPHVAGCILVFLTSLILPF